jgi:hypothetical protein
MPQYCIYSISTAFDQLPLSDRVRVKNDNVMDNMTGIHRALTLSGASSPAI